MTISIPIEIGDAVYVAYPKRNKVCRFQIDCIKVFPMNITAHGYVHGLCGNFAIPSEISLKYLDKRCVFRKKKDAQAWLDLHKPSQKGETS